MTRTTLQILGRPKGATKGLKLDDKREQIEKYRAIGLGIRVTAEHTYLLLNALICIHIFTSYSIRFSVSSV